MSSFQIERKLWDAGYKFIAGVDEVGRGPIAGNIMASAVIFPALLESDERSGLEQALQGVDDSKKLSKHKRQQCIHKIRKNAIAIATAAVSPRDIDRMGIGKAVTRCMALAVLQLHIKPDYLLVDGLKTLSIEDFEYAFENLSYLTTESDPTRKTTHAKYFAQIPSKALVKGDSISLSISSASIIAKVTRDRLMSFYARNYHGYGFENNNGYGTTEHLRQLAVLGPTPLHRYSFSPLSNGILNFKDEQLKR